jgi:NitT/TauT family transport system permease protein
VKSKVRKTAENALYAVIVVGLIFAVWSTAAAVVGSEFIMPTVPDTFRALGETLALPSFWRALGATLLRCVLSFAVSVALFFALFFLSSAFDAAARIVRPIVSVLRTLPTMAVSLVLAIWTGAKVAPIVLGVLVIMPVLYSSAAARAGTVPKELREIARLCGASRAQRFFNVTLPYAAGGFPESLPSALSFTVKIVIAAEILMQTAGSIGILMYKAQVYYMTATLLALVAAAVIVSVALEYIARAVLVVTLSRFDG